MSWDKDDGKMEEERHSLKELIPIKSVKNGGKYRTLYPKNRRKLIMKIS